MLCHTDLMGLMDMDSERPIIRLTVCTHSMECHSMVSLSMVRSSALAVVVSHGVEAEAEYSVAGEGSVVGK